MATLEQKLQISLISAGLFVLLNLPQTYDVTNKLLSGLVGPLASGGCPTMVGLLIHAVVFYMGTRLMMKGSYTSEHLKHKRSLITTLIFVLLSSPMAFRLVRSLLGSSIASATGCPTMQGILVHGAVHAAVLLLLMRR